MTNNEGDSMEVYDFVEADTLDEHDQIVVNDVDYLELSKVVKDGDSVLVTGYSHISGDVATYILNYDQEVGLWTV
jgi:hypothetical protein